MRRIIERNRLPSGPTANIGMGFAQTADGLVRIFSLGFLHTRLPLMYSGWRTKKHIAKLKEAHYAKLQATQHR